MDRLLCGGHLCGAYSGSTQGFLSPGSILCQIYLVSLHLQPRKISFPLIKIAGV
jgi:hypothetical protein